MPAGAIIGAAGSVAGGLASGKGASKAAKIQAQAQAQQTQALQQMYESNKALMTPSYDRGEAAAQQEQALLGLSGDPAAAQATLAATPGYHFAVDQSLRSASANAYAGGLGNSGAALKALQDRASGLASSTYNNYVNQLGSVADRGVSAMNGLVSQGNYTTGAINQQTQAGADSASANAVYQGNNLANILKGVSGAAGQAFGSSYGNPATSRPAQAGGNPIGGTLPSGMINFDPFNYVPGYAGPIYKSKGTGY